MSKLSLDALKERAEAVTTEELMANIGGGTENSCHDKKQEPKKKEPAVPYPVFGPWF